MSDKKTKLCINAHKKTVEVNKKLEPGKTDLDTLNNKLELLNRGYDTIKIDIQSLKEEEINIIKSIESCSTSITEIKNILHKLEHMRYCKKLKHQ